MEDTSILESDLLMPSLRPRLKLMLILLFFMVPMDMVCHMLDILDTDMVPIVMVLELMDMVFLMDILDTDMVDKYSIF